MYKIIYMKADYEPWWKFEGWESNIIYTKSFESEEELNRELKQIIENFRQKFKNEASKENKYFAFWSNDEVSFCEACGDDSQTYHGIIVEK